MSEVVPAATLVLFRAAESGPPEFLMLERAAAMSFAGGAMVFPGGRIDAADIALAATLPKAPEDAAPRIAAIRETIEEAGLAIGVTPAPASNQLTTIRQGLHAGEVLGGLLAAHGLTLALDALTPFARWKPDLPGRVFDTHFYLACLPEEAPAPRVDRTENVRLIWTSAAQALADAEAGRTRLIFPTRRNLERLALFASHEDAVADAHAHPVETVTPWRETIDGIDYLRIPDHLGYPITRELLETAKRA